jgi:cobaltochelatase CobS
MTDMTVRLSAGQRDELKKALRNHPAIVAAGIQVKGLKSEMLALAERFNVTIPDAPTAAEVFSDDDDEAPAAEDMDAELEPTEDPAALVRAVLAPMGAGDLQSFQEALSALAKRAVTPRVVTKTVTKTVTVRAAAPVTCTGHVPTVTGTGTAGQVIGIKGAHGRLPLTLWDAPDAPPVDPHYIWPETTGAILTQLRRGRNVMLTGPAGTGKSSFAEQLAARTGRPFARISCHEQTDAATLTGMTVPAKSGGVQWQDGQLTAAIRRPGTIVLVDEPSVARPGAMFVLQAVMDGARTLSIEETGERVPVADGVAIILADNTAGTGDDTGAYEGTRRMNRATLDRCGITAQIGYLPPDAERDVLVARTGCTPGIAALAVAYATETRSAAGTGKLTIGLGLRRLMAWCELVTDGVPHGEAFDLSVWATSAADDRETLRQLYRAHVSEAAVKGAR